MKKLRDWADEALDDEERGALGAIAGHPRGALTVLNKLEVDGKQIEGALRAVAALSANQRNGLWQGLAIQAYAEAAGLEPTDVVAGALHARIVALNRWTVENDPHRLSDAASVLAAAARCPLVETPKGLTFEAERFTDLVEFCGELPW